MSHDTERNGRPEPEVTERCPLSWTASSTGRFASAMRVSTVAIESPHPQSIPFGAPGVPIYFRDRIPGASAIGLIFTTPDGNNPADNSKFEVVLGASQ